MPCWQGDVNPADAPMHNVMRFNEQACGRAAETLGDTPTQVYLKLDALVMDFIDGEDFLKMK